MTIQRQSYGERYQTEESFDQEAGKSGRWRLSKKKVSRTTRLARRVFLEKKQELRLHEVEELDPADE